MKKINYLFLIFSLFFNSLSADTITTSPSNNSTFFPDTLIVYVGDTVTFIMGPSHNAVEVSENTWLNNGTSSNGGFDITYGRQVRRRYSQVHRRGSAFRSLDAGR